MMMMIAESLTFHLCTERNNLTGTLPRELFEITSLTSLSILYETSLIGNLPHNLGNLQDLETLQVSETGMTGTIPDLSSKLTNLIVVNLSANQFSGELPSGILSEQRDSLRFGVFNRNSFSGSIPQLYRDSPLILLDLSYNMLSGSLPSTLYDLRALRTLIFKVNMISGTVAPSIGDLTQLAWLDGSSNFLEGSVPTQMELLTNLKKIYLWENSLTGTVPNLLKELDRLVILDLSSNLLSGTIPSELGELEDLIGLNLASNQLTGNVPSTLRDISTLTALWVQNNEISGGLEETFCNQSGLSIEIEADCHGDVPEVECSCCTTCCEDGDCFLNSLSVCELYANSFELRDDGDRESQCDCSEDGSNVQCTESCESCNFEGSICARSLGYGHSFDSETGDIVSFHNTMQYVKGRNETILYRKDYAETGCHVEVDGQECRSCDTLTCSGSTLKTFTVDCTNLDDGFLFNGCEVTDPGYLTLMEFNQPSRTSGCTQYLFFGLLSPTN